MVSGYLYELILESIVQNNKNILKQQQKVKKEVPVRLFWLMSSTKRFVQLNRSSGISPERLLPPTDK